MNPAATQAGVGARLANDGPRLIIGAQEAFRGLNRLAQQWADLAGTHPRYTKLRIQKLLLTHVRF